MEQKSKNMSFAAIGLKAGQQAGTDLSKVLTKGSIPALLSGGLGNICRIGFGGLAGYALDDVASMVEEYAPKPMRGALSIAAATIGVGAVINYFGDTMGLEEGLGVMESTKQVIQNYQDSFMNLISWSPNEVNSSHFAGATMCLKAGYRLTKNLGGTIIEKIKEKKQNNGGD